MHYIRSKNEKTIYFLYEDFFNLFPKIASRDRECITLDGDAYLPLKEILPLLDRDEMELIVSQILENLFTEGVIVFRELLLSDMDLLMRVNRLLIAINESFIASGKGMDDE